MINKLSLSLLLIGFCSCSLFAQIDLGNLVESTESTDTLSLTTRFSQRIESIRYTIEKAYTKNELSDDFIILISSTNEAAKSEKTWKKFLFDFEKALTKPGGSESIKDTLRSMIGDINSLVAQAENNNDKELVEIVNQKDFTNTKIISPNEFIKLIEEYSEPVSTGYITRGLTITDNLTLDFDKKVDELRKLVEQTINSDNPDREFIELIEDLNFENTTEKTWRQFVEILSQKSNDKELSENENIQLFIEIVTEMENILSKSEQENNREFDLLIDQTEFKNTSMMSPEEFDEILLSLIKEKDSSHTEVASEVETPKLKYLGLYEAKMDTTGLQKEFDAKIDELKELINQAILAETADREFIELIEELEFANTNEKNWRQFVEILNSKADEKEGSSSDNIQIFIEIVNELNNIIENADKRNDRHFIELISQVNFKQTLIMSPQEYQQLISIMLDDLYTEGGETIEETTEEEVVEEVVVIEVIEEEVTETELIVINNSEYPSVYFDYKSAELNNIAIEQLNKTVTNLKAQPNVIIILQGHTDPVGGDNYNDNLSLKRAIAVERYLVSKGIGRTRIKLNALGESNLKATNNNAKENQHDRRVEIKVATN